MVRRAVLVERPTEYAELLARHGTREQARFFLAGRGRGLEEVERRHRTAEEVRARVLAEIPVDWRRATVQRAELDRFLFEPEDVLLVVGQDGLVANVAKYLDGQPVIGLNPAPHRYPGVLVPHPPEAAADLLRDLATGRERADALTMASAALDDGQTLLALNELFVGHRTHQSARYTLSHGPETERQSSSGVIFAVHRPRASAPRRASCTDRPLAHLPRPRGMAEPGHRDRAHGGHFRPTRERDDHLRARRGRRGVRGRDRGRPPGAPVGPDRDDRDGRSPAHARTLSHVDFRVARSTPT